MRMRKEYPILAALIVALGLYLYLRPTDRTGYELPALPAVDPSTITKLDVTGPAGTVTVEREGDGWVVGPQRYPASRQAVESMLKVVADLTLTALISESQAYERYELDPARRVAVTAWAGERKVRELFVGKVAPTYRHTHVQLAGDPHVYHARESFRATFDKEAEALRDKQVLAFARDKVQALRIVTPAARVEVRRKTPEAQTPSSESAAPAAPEGQWTTADGQPLEAALVERVLGDLASLECERYLDPPPEGQGQAPAYQVEIEAEATHTLTVLPAPADQPEAFPGRSSDNAYAFVLTQWDVERLGEFVQSVTAPPPPKGAEAGAAQ